jgi:hypothetical protein
MAVSPPRAVEPIVDRPSSLKRRIALGAEAATIRETSSRRRPHLRPIALGRVERHPASTSTTAPGDESRPPSAYKRSKTGDSLRTAPHSGASSFLAAASEPAPDLPATSGTASTTALSRPPQGPARYRPPAALSAG